MPKYIMVFRYPGLNRQCPYIGPFESRNDAEAFGKKQDKGTSETCYGVDKLLSPEEFLERRKKHQD